MTDPVRWTGQMPPTANQGGGRQPARNGAGGGGGGDGTNLADILERVLDKGIVIAGDVQINLLDIELLTIKLRLIVASVDRAKEMGIDWWERDPTLSSGHSELEKENQRLRERLEALEGRDAPAALEGGEQEEADEIEDADVVEEDESEPEPEPVKPRRKRRTDG
ncbi:gas vesicle protein [Actinomycetospora sp. CA-101289]|uniref:gas vesicle protein n=1 Tax=Actinomycetospora sp. CA-101289 TaxID=3239893 RepID=UPI003D951AB0